MSTKPDGEFKALFIIAPATKSKSLEPVVVMFDVNFVPSYVPLIGDVPEHQVQAWKEMSSQGDTLLELEFLENGILNCPLEKVLVDDSPTSSSSVFTSVPIRKKPVKTPYMALVFDGAIINGERIAHLELPERITRISHFIKSTIGIYNTYLPFVIRTKGIFACRKQELAVLRQRIHPEVSTDASSIQSHLQAWSDSTDPRDVLFRISNNSITTTKTTTTTTTTTAHEYKVPGLISNSGSSRSAASNIGGTDDDADNMDPERYWVFIDESNCFHYKVDGLMFYKGDQVFGQCIAYKIKPFSEADTVDLAVKMRNDRQCREEHGEFVLELFSSQYNREESRRIRVQHSLTTTIQPDKWGFRWLQSSSGHKTWMAPDYMIECYYSPSAAKYVPVRERRDKTEPNATLTCQSVMQSQLNLMYNVAKMITYAAEDNKRNGYPLKNKTNPLLGEIAKFCDFHHRDYSIK